MIFVAFAVFALSLLIAVSTFVSIRKSVRSNRNLPASYHSLPDTTKLDATVQSVTLAVVLALGILMNIGYAVAFDLGSDLDEEIDALINDSPYP